MKKKKIKIPIYFGTLILVKSEDWQPINKKYGYKLDNSFDAVAFNRTTKKGNSKYFIAFKGKKKPSLSVISHEVVHVVNQIYIDGQITLDPVNDEPQAYLHGWIVSQIEKFLKND